MVCGEQGDTHAHIAARGGHLFLLKWLSKKGMAIDNQNELGDTCAHEAALWGHLGVLKWLYQETPFDIFAARNRKQLSVFHHAASGGHLGILQWLHHQHPAGIVHEDHNVSLGVHLFTHSLSVTHISTSREALLSTMRRASARKTSWCGSRRLERM